MDHDHDILLIRSVGGAGDIYTLHMLLHDIKAQHPGARLVFALPEHYHDLVRDHEDIDQLVTPSRACPADFPISYEVSTCCGAYEYKLTPKADLNRADTWAAACGVRIHDHSMRFRVSEEDRAEGRRLTSHKPTGRRGPPDPIPPRDLLPLGRLRHRGGEGGEELPLSGIWAG